MARTVGIKGEYIRLDSALKFAGAAVTGGQAKTLVLGGLVKVNSETCFMRTKKLRPGDRFECGGEVYEVVAE